MYDPDINGADDGTFRAWLSSISRSLGRSGLLTALLLCSVIAALAIAYHAHMLGSFHRLKVKANLESERRDAPDPRPGGQEAIVLVRSRLAGDTPAEFLSVTLLPGRGMNVFQIRAYIPGRGEVDLLASPTLEAAASSMTGKGDDTGGRHSLQMGGAFTAPWADSIWGTPGQPNSLTANWQDQTIALPATPDSAAHQQAIGGLLLAAPADTATSETLPDGGSAEAVFHTADFAGHWPSHTDITVRALLSSQTIEFTVMATNTGSSPEPIGIGWHPRFAIAPGDRAQLRLRIPGEMRVELRGHDGQPTGRLIPVAGGRGDVSVNGGVPLADTDIDDCFVNLQQKMLDNGPSAELTNPAAGYGLRLIALSPTIRAMHVVAPATGNFISIDPQYNFPDPFGREWPAQSNTGIVTLQPHQTTEWKVRLELLSLHPTSPAN